MSFDLKTIILYIMCMLVPLFLLKLFQKPLTWIIRLCFGCVIGGLALFALNFVLSKTGFVFPINPLNALTVGILGVPGIILVAFIVIFA